MVAQWKRIHLPKKEIQVQSLGLEDPLGGKWHPTLVFMPEKSHGQRSLAGYSLQRGHKESDTTEHTHTHKSHIYKCLKIIININNSIMAKLIYI